VGLSQKRRSFHVPQRWDRRVAASPAAVVEAGARKDANQVLRDADKCTKSVASPPNVERKLLLLTVTSIKHLKRCIPLSPCTVPTPPTNDGASVAPDRTGRTPQVTSREWDCLRSGGASMFLSAAILASPLRRPLSLKQAS
jgi:hypothetical protein